jgi:DnaJ-class molecular chaperone
MNYYVVLGIAEDADGDTIRSAFRALARRHHPDAGAGSSAAEFRRALEAYETLSDTERRRRYDSGLRLARARSAAIEEPVVSRSVPDSIFGSSFGFRSTRVTFSRSVSLDALFEELFAALGERTPWYRR